MSESATVAETRVKLSRGDVRLFRNNVGKLQDRFGQWVAYGLCPGSGDLIGFKSVTITDSMVGKRIAVFVSLEGKGKAGRMRAEQGAWADIVRAHGGIAGTFRSVDDAQQILDGVTNES